MKEAEVIFQPSGRRFNLSVGESLYSAAKAVDVEALCGGRGLCGKCRIIIREGANFLSSISASEENFLSKEEFNEGYRLACQAVIASAGKIIVEVPFESQVGKQKLAVSGIEPKIRLNPYIKEYFLEVSPPTLKDYKPDFERIVDGLKIKYGLNIESITHFALRKLPIILRDSEFKVNLVVRNEKEIIDVKQFKEKEVYGFAVDIGTTKVAGYLIDLINNKVVATVSMMNPQIPYGEDVISRISYALRKPLNLKVLHKTIVNGINQLIKEACDKTNVDPNSIYELVIVGNTAMHHLFFNINPKFLALSPYVPALKKSLYVKSKELSVKINPEAEVYSLPLIAGFVGADAVADILATEIYKLKEKALLIDIGTNTEIILSNSENLICCSTASGPAFEGAHIKHGMRAATGAIEKVWINPEDLNPIYKTVDNEKPKGICGSGIIDAIAEMLKAKIIDFNGRIKTEIKHPRIRRRNSTIEYVIAWREEAAIDKDITITQKDIFEIQLAKAAIYTGISILMKKFNVKPEDLSKVFIAGAFGLYLNPENAKTIGMIPDIPLDKIIFAGNTAGSGARMALISKDVREKADKLVNEINYIELAAEPSFEHEFASALYFPHKNIELFPTIKKLLVEE
ncbi:MAG: ASKHA domain-containing protein [Candidatus Bathyarchaeia archaeon]